jgi:hypothetical protein
LGSDNRDCAELGSEENDEAYISTYYTRKEINESFLLEVVQKHEYAYELCQLQDLIIKKQDERWILYLNDDVMGYVEIKKGILIKEFCIVWDRKKIDQRRYGFNKPEKDNKREEDVHMVVHLPFCNTPSEKIWGTFPPV